MVLDAGLVWFGEVGGGGKAVLSNFGQFEEHLFDDIFPVGLAVEVDVELEGGFAVFEDASEGLEDEIDEPEGGLLVLKDLDDVLFKEVLNLVEAVEEPVLAQTGHEVVDVLEAVVLAVQQHPVEDQLHVLR